MKVYNIKKEEISKFTSLSNNGSDFKKTVQEMWEKELTSPEWCFVIEEKGKIIGRIGYWSSKEDKEDEISVLKFGAEEHARNHFNDLKSIDFSPKNWFIAYNEKNIIGLVVPQKFNNEVGAINYIGVIPEERGKGYVIDLLNKGIKNLFKRNVSKIIADIDEQNFPMEKALLESGFKEEKKIWVYDLSLEK